MARTKGAVGKFNLEKEVAALVSKVDTLTENSHTPEMNEALLKAGIGLGLHTLIRAASGDKSIEDLSATNMVSAADKLLQLGMKILGDDAFKELKEKAKEEGLSKEQEGLVGEVNDLPPKNSSGLISPYQPKDLN